uniref:Uncharacterized protein n=1 Tax=Panagrolaimus sp. PS1159 TaxID=55785 RepID=A0AC35F0G2_9BILA
MAPKRPKLNPEILEQIFHEIKIPSGNEEEPEEYPLTAFMLAGKESFNLALNFYNQMKEATIGQKCIGYKNYKDEEYTIYREFPLFNLFGKTLLASVEKIICFRNYPKDLPLFKYIKRLNELTAEAFYILTYSKSFAQIEFVERVELQTNVKDLMNIHQLPFPCNELCLKDFGFSRFMKMKFKKIAALNENFISSKNLMSIKTLTLEDYIDDIDIPNLQLHEIAASFSTKFPNLQRFTVIFIIFIQNNLDSTAHFTEEFVQALIIFIIFIQNNLDSTAQFTEEFVQALSIRLPDIQFTINFELYLSCLKQSHVDFYDNIIQDQRYEVNQEEKTARRIISSGKCKMDILFSFG